MAKQVTARSTVVAFANDKGGVSKSSMAANLGAHLAGAGDSVTLIDADPQGSLSRWHELRQMFDPSGNPQLYPATQETLRVKVDKARKAGARWIIIDTALREFDEVVPPSIPRVADFVVVPARPSPVDIEASRAAFEASDGRRHPIACCSRPTIQHGRCQRARSGSSSVCALASFWPRRWDTAPPMWARWRRARRGLSTTLTRQQRRRRRRTSRQFGPRSSDA